MKVRVYRNLDRPFALLGIKGKFIGVAGALAVLCVIVSIVIGTIAGTFIGLAFCAVALVLAYLLVSELQVHLGSKTVDRKMAAMGMPKFVIVNSKVWRR